MPDKRKKFFTVKNIYKISPHNLPRELTEVILSKGSLRIEKIVSRGHSSPPGYWYDQKKNEFVILLKGKAKLTLENDKELTLKPGDFLNIPSRLKHRVKWTHPKKETVWLDIFY